MIAATLIAVIGLVSAAIVAAITIQMRDQTWKRCPMCRTYHRGNVMTKSLPLDTDGVIHPQICRSCLESETFLRNRETELTLK